MAKEQFKCLLGNAPVYTGYSRVRKKKTRGIRHCYNCRQVGHIARNCFAINPNITREVLQQQQQQQQQHQNVHKMITNNQTKAQHKSAELSIDKVLKKDAKVFLYNKAYDNREKKNEHINAKSQYIQNVLVRAEKCKIQYGHSYERLIQKERKAEGDQFKDKNAFVTDSYKRKLDEEGLKLSTIEDINDVSKQKDMGSFYRYLSKEELCKNENDKMYEIKNSTMKSDAFRQYIKHDSPNTSDTLQDRDLLKSNSSVNSKRRKIEFRDDKKSVGEIVYNLEVKLKESIIEIAKVKDILSNKEPKPKEGTKEEPKNKVVEIDEIKPKINIWLKRTVGNIFEDSRQRYFQRHETN